MTEKLRSVISKFRPPSRDFVRHSWPYLAILAVASGIVYGIFNQSLFNSFRCASLQIRQNYQASNGFFIDNQVIVSGTTQDIQAVVDPLGLTQIESCDLSYLNSRKAPNPALTPQQREALVMRLYEIPDSSDLSVEDVVSQINGARASEPARYIFADPNYLTSLLDSRTDPCALPNGGGGSGGGTPYGDPGIPAAPDEPRMAREAFMRQWAFVGSQGINLNLPPSSGFDGQEVRVGVFDTSPFRTHYPYLSRIGIALPSPLWLKTREAPGASLVSNHGLFVAGLIHGIAPKSKIQLIRVLNDYGCGELWQIDRALQDYTSRMSAWTGDLDETVINMSLGVRTQDEAEIVNEDQDEAEDIDPDENADSEPTVDGSRLTKEIFSLEQTITEADRLGAVIIAAAGNDSYDITEPAKEMRYPARYPNVIGVAATNIDGNLSCFSNKGDVAAPGGNSGVDPNNSTDTCAPRANSSKMNPNPCNHTTSNDIANCPYFLISLAQTDTGFQYIYWSGTSFAAPLVSGMAALAYEEMEKNRVICLIEGGTTGTPDLELGTGVINIGDLTNQTVIQQCP